MLTGSGGYDGSTAKLHATIAPGSGTGDLDGIRGTLSSTSTHDDYPNMPLILDYEFG